LSLLESPSADAASTKGTARTTTSLTHHHYHHRPPCLPSRRRHPSPASPQIILPSRTPSQRPACLSRTRAQHLSPLRTLAPPNAVIAGTAAHMPTTARSTAQHKDDDDDAPARRRVAPHRESLFVPAFGDRLSYRISSPQISFSSDLTRSPSHRSPLSRTIAS
jgi:hypothetical protein